MTTGIPEFQQTNPTGHDLPYLPICTQLEARPGSAEGWSAWGPVINGEHQNWLGIPSSWEEGRSHQELEAYGFCTTKEGAITVPYEVEDSSETSQNQGIPAIYTDRIAQSDQPEANVSENIIPSVYRDRIQSEEQPVSQAVEEVPSRPDVYQDRVNNIQSGETTISADTVIFGGTFVICVGTFVFLRRQYLPRMAAIKEVELRSQTIYEDYEEKKEIVSDISSTPVPEYTPTPVSAPIPPSTWAHAGSLISQGVSGRNGIRNAVETSSETLRNAVETIPKWSRNDFEMMAELSQRIQGLKTVNTQGVSVETESETQRFDIDPTNQDARTLYFELRSEGVSTMKELGDRIFGVKGGDRWSEVSAVLSQWNMEWEKDNA
jgi:hypothetical protein